MSSEKEQIYIVDDDESVCRALSLLLDTFGFEVQIFASAAEFLNSVLKHPPGCLILDVHMAEMDGFALQQQLNTNGFRLPIIFISADKNLKFSEEYLKAAGAVGFLQKPFNDQALVNLIKVAVKKKGEIRMKKFSLLMLVALFLFVVIGAGCASTHKTTTTKTTVTYPAEEGNKGYLKNTTTVVTSNDQQNNPVTKETETTTTSTETKAEHQSILGATLHAIGWVIALPFRLVGGLIGWIF